MRKSVLAVLASCIVLLLLSGCGSSSKTSSGSQARNLPAGTMVYFGSQAPGDAWEITMFADGTFKANNMTLQTTYSGTYVTNPNGTLKFTVNKHDSTTLNPALVVYGSLINDTAVALMGPGTNNNPIIAYAEGAQQNLDKCSTVTSDHLGIYLPPSGFDLTSGSPAYAIIRTTSGAPNYSFLMDVYTLGGSPYVTQGNGTTFTCTNGVLKSSTQSNYAVIAESGAFVVDLGSDGGIAGVQKPSAAIDLAALQTKQFLATYAHSNSRTAVIGGASTTSSGVGGAGTFTMGGFANPATDPFANHGTTYTIDFSSATQATPGIVQNAKVNTHAAVMAVNVLNGKLIVIGLTTDQSSTDPLFFTLMEK